jgi:hypothetical protein
MSRPHSRTVLQLPLLMLPLLLLTACGDKGDDSGDEGAFGLSDAARGACYDACQAKSEAVDCTDDDTEYLNYCHDICTAVLNVQASTECLQTMADYKSCQADQTFHCETEYGDLRLSDDWSQCSDLAEDYIDCFPDYD